MAEPDSATAASLVARLSQRTEAESPSGFPRDRAEAAQPGLYSWWCDDAGRDQLSAVLGERLPALIYAGQAGATTSRSNVERAATLGSRITGNHLRGNISSSTFRRTLAAILFGPLDLRLRRPGNLEPASNNAVSAWMRTHLAVVIAPHPDRANLAAVETAALQALDPPLNLMGMRTTPIRRQVSELRRSIGAAATLSVAPASTAGDALGAPAHLPARTGPAGRVGQPDTTELLQRITQVVRPGDVIYTLANGSPNRIEAVGPDGVLVSTPASDRKGTGPQLVPMWMIDRTWRHLVQARRVTQTFVLASDGLDVKRSAFVMALIARFDGISLLTSRPVELGYHRSAAADRGRHRKAGR